jgi:hypothetical protein
VRFHVVATLAAPGAVIAIVGFVGASLRVVAERRRELAIRLAPGATPADTARLVVRRGLTLVAVALAVGLALAAAGPGVRRGYSRASYCEADLGRLPSSWGMMGRCGPGSSRSSWPAVAASGSIR